MASLDMRDFPSLEALSGSLCAYVRGYNLSAHSSLKGSTPQERSFSEPEKVRRLPEEKMKTDFLLELERKVSADSVVTIGNVEYEVDMRFARQRIRLRCSPGMDEVYVAEADGTPRVLNRLCCQSLLCADAKKLDLVDADTVMQAINDCELG